MDHCGWNNANDERSLSKQIEGWDLSCSNSGGDTSRIWSSQQNSVQEPPSAHKSGPRPFHPSTDDTDAYIAAALQNMNIAQRDALFHELHGVADAIEETPGFLKESFDKLRLELDSQTRKAKVLSGLDCRSFLLAHSRDPQYVHSDFWYKAFLRAERFDIKAAAIRMIRYFDFKQKAFGDAHICSDITQDLLSADDLAAYRKGINQMLPVRDAMGRAISVLFPNLTSDYLTPERERRLFLYENWSLIQDEETQRNGLTCVIIVLNPSQSNEKSSCTTEAHFMDMRMLRVSSESVNVLPIRYTVYHNCFSDIRWKSTMKLGLQLVPESIRARMKIHFGPAMECAYTLMGYGIPPGSLPLNMNGELKNKQHLEFIKMRRAQEEMIKERRLIPLYEFNRASSELNAGSPADDAYKHSPRCVIVVPSNDDILCGRGKPLHSHPGNIRLHALVDGWISRYKTCTRKLEKTELFIELVKIVKKDFGGRFIKQDSSKGVWMVVDEVTARNKISRVFRRRELELEELEKHQAEKDAANADVSSSCKRTKVDGTTN